MEQNEYIDSRVDQQINWFDKKSMCNQKLYKRLRVFEILCALSIPLLLNYFDCLENLNFIVSLISALIVITAGLFGIYKFEENWINYRATCESLKREKFLFLTKAAHYNINDPYPIFVERIEELLSNENGNWISIMKSNDTQ